MSDLLPVRGKQISCTSCSVQRAAGLLRTFLSSDVATEAGMSRGYVETVAKALDDMVGRQKHVSEGCVKNVSMPINGGLGFTGEADVAGNVGVTQRLQKPEVRKTKQKAKALSDFEALLGNEVEKTTYGLDDEEHGKLGLEEKVGVTEMIATSTRGTLDGEDYEREVKKTKKKELQRGITSGSPAKVQETPGSNKKNKKKHKGNFVDGDVQAESGSGELATEELISEVGVRGREEKVSGVVDSIHKKVKKRTSEEFLEDSINQPRKSKKSKVLN